MLVGLTGLVVWLLPALAGPPVEVWPAEAVAELPPHVVATIDEVWPDLADAPGDCVIFDVLAVGDAVEVTAWRWDQQPGQHVGVSVFRRDDGRHFFGRAERTVDNDGRLLREKLWEDDALAVTRAWRHTPSATHRYEDDVRYERQRTWTVDRFADDGAWVRSDTRYIAGPRRVASRQTLQRDAEGRPRIAAEQRRGQEASSCQTAWTWQQDAGTFITTCDGEVTATGREQRSDGRLVGRTLVEGTPPDSQVTSTWTWRYSPAGALVAMHREVPFLGAVDHELTWVGDRLTRILERGDDSLHVHLRSAACVVQPGRDLLHLPTPWP